MDFAIVQIGSRQYLVKPKISFEVDKLTDNQNTLEVDKVLLLMLGDKMEIGQPYLKKTLSFEVLQTVKKDKIRVAKYHAKANYRKVRGQKREMSKIQLIEEIEKQAVKK